MWELSLQRSPIYYAHKSKTAVLILGGKDDPRVNPSQSLEYYTRLKMNGHPAVRLVQYPGEGHGNQKQPGRADVLYRTLEWLDWYVKDGKPLDGADAAARSERLATGSSFRRSERGRGFVRSVAGPVGHRAHVRARDARAWRERPRPQRPREHGRPGQREQVRPRRKPSEADAGPETAHIPRRTQKNTAPEKPGAAPARSGCLWLYSSRHERTIIGMYCPRCLRDRLGAVEYRRVSRARVVVRHPSHDDRPQYPEGSVDRNVPLDVDQPFVVERSVDEQIARAVEEPVSPRCSS